MNRTAENSIFPEDVRLNIVAWRDKHCYSKISNAKWLISQILITSFVGRNRDTKSSNQKHLHDGILEIVLHTDERSSRTGIVSSGCSRCRLRGDVLAAQYVASVVPPRYGHGVVGDGHEGGGVMLWQDREL